MLSGALFAVFVLFRFGSATVQTWSKAGLSAPSLSSVSRRIDAQDAQEAVATHSHSNRGGADVPLALTMATEHWILDAQEPQRLDPCKKKNLGGCGLPPG